MGIDGFFKKIGKAALKVAPIAASFIPGIGPLAGMAIGGLTSGVSKKLEGGSWKDALLSGGIGAGAGAAGKGLAGLTKGVGPSSGILKNIVGGVGGGGSGLGGAIGQTLGGIGQNALQGGLANLGNALTGQDGQEQGLQSGQLQELGQQGRRGLSPSWMDQSSPNLALAIEQGKRQAIRNQPFRDPSFDVKGPLPPIYPTGTGRRKKQLEVTE